ncbi:protein CutA homolog isoform X3 [Bubalus kerabau]|uniref:protein CutA homolog isoform X1 n=1 Tax=Bubalus bubalis TaxID=89462 RepID=UPI001D11F184|nr:protein CutA homolog isoform X1 [Bubalus bubalis]XP_055435482.1 protein CutA homolog isoform X3 [Bubalus carabanensis]
MVFGICENGEGKLVFLFLQGLEVCTGCLGYMFLESCPVKNESLFPHPLHPLLPASLAGTWPGSGRQQVVRGEGLRPLEPIHPPATFPQAAVPIACAGSVTSDAMDRLGSRCPLPGSTRPSIFICFLILTASLLTYSVLRTLSLQLLSVVTGSYVSGTYSIVFVNCPNEQIARDIARAILDKKLAASVNILPKASSLYYWNGEIEEATEILLLIKTKTSKIHMLSSYIRLVHPFEIPELFSLPMDQGDVRYLKWLEEGMEEE